MAEAKPHNLTPDSEHDHFFSAAKVVASLTMVSRVLGLVRDLVLVPLGLPAIADVFWTAFENVDVAAVRDADPDVVLADHWQLYKLVKAGDMGNIRQALIDHFSHVEERIQTLIV